MACNSSYRYAPGNPCCQAAAAACGPCLKPTDPVRTDCGVVKPVALTWTFSLAGLGSCVGQPSTNTVFLFSAGACNWQSVASAGPVWTLTIDGQTASLSVQLDATHSIVYALATSQWQGTCSNLMSLKPGQTFPSGCAPPATLCVQPSTAVQPPCSKCSWPAHWTVSLSGFSQNPDPDVVQWAPPCLKCDYLNQQFTLRPQSGLTCSFPLQPGQGNTGILWCSVGNNQGTACFVNILTETGYQNPPAMRLSCDQFQNFCPTWFPLPPGINATDYGFFFVIWLPAGDGAAPIIYFAPLASIICMSPITLQFSDNITFIASNRVPVSAVSGCLGWPGSVTLNPA